MMDKARVDRNGVPIGNFEILPSGIQYINNFVRRAARIPFQIFCWLIPKNSPPPLDKDEWPSY
jgi:hypothetical protein